MVRDNSRSGVQAAREGSWHSAPCSAKAFCTQPHTSVTLTAERKTAAPRLEPGSVPATTNPAGPRPGPPPRSAHRQALRCSAERRLRRAQHQGLLGAPSARPGTGLRSGTLPAPPRAPVPLTGVLRGPPAERNAEGCRDARGAPDGRVFRAPRPGEPPPAPFAQRRPRDAPGTFRGGDTCVARDNRAPRRRPPLGPVPPVSPSLSPPRACAAAARTAGGGRGVRGSAGGFHSEATRSRGF